MFVCFQQQKNLEGYVGFASLPNQVYRKSVKRGFEFTLMVVGKKTLIYFICSLQLQNTWRVTKLATHGFVMDSVYATVVMTTWEASCLVLNICQFETTFLTFGLNAVWITTQEAGVEWQWFHILFILKNARTLQWRAPLNGWHFRKLSFEIDSFTIKQVIRGLSCFY